MEKLRLLDVFEKQMLYAGEFGGITQHIRSLSNSLKK